MTNTITGNEDQPEDNKIPEINLEKAFIEKYGPEEGRRLYNQAIARDEKRPQINLAEIREKKKKRLQELAAQAENNENTEKMPVINLDELLKKKEKRMQELQNQAEQGQKQDKLPFINLDQVLIRQYGEERGRKMIQELSAARQKEEQMPEIDMKEMFIKKYGAEEGMKQYKKFLEEDSEKIRLPFTVPRPEEEEQTLPFSIDREEEGVLPFEVPREEEEEEGVLPFAVGYAQPEGETERLDEVLGKEQRIAQYGITSKELRTRPVLLEFQTSDGKDEVYSWTAAAEKDYALLEQMSCFEAVGYILARAPLKKADGTLPDAEGKERIRLEKSLLEGDFGITTEDSDELLPEGKGKYTVGGKPSPDERQRPLLEYLRSGKDSQGRDVWHQRLGVCLPFSLDDI